MESGTFLTHLFSGDQIIDIESFTPVSSPFHFNSELNDGISSGGSSADSYYSYFPNISYLDVSQLRARNSASIKVIEVQSDSFENPEVEMESEDCVETSLAYEVSQSAPLLESPDSSMDTILPKSFIQQHAYGVPTFDDYEVASILSNMGEYLRRNPRKDSSSTTPEVDAPEDQNGSIIGE